jgi:MoxR-like ATPase
MATDTPVLKVTAAGLTTQLLLAFASSQVLYVEGNPGGGKTQIIRKAASSAGYAPMDFALSECMPEDFGGIVTADLAARTAVRLMPDIIDRIRRTQESTGKPVAVFFDELTNASNSVFSACMKILHEGTGGGFTVPEGTRFVAAGNDPTSSSLASELPAPLLNRMAKVVYDGPTWDEWQAHMLGKNPHPALMSYVRANPTALGIDADFNSDSPQATCRSLEAASDVLKIIDQVSETGAKISPADRVTALASRIGGVHAVGMGAHLKYADRLVAWSAITANPAKASIPEDFTVAYMQMILVLKASVDKATTVTALKYVRRMSKELVALYVNSLLLRDDAAVYYEAFDSETIAAVRASSSLGQSLQSKLKIV